MENSEMTTKIENAAREEEIKAWEDRMALDAARADEHEDMQIANESERRERDAALRA